MKYSSRKVNGLFSLVILPWFSVIYIFTRWYTINTLLNTALFIIAAVIILQLFSTCKFKKYFLPTFILLVLIYVDYFVGMLYSTYLLGQISYSVVFVFCLFMVLAYAQNTAIGKKTFELLVVFSILSCGAIILQAIFPQAINAVNRFVLQNEAYNTMYLTYLKGYMSGVNGYVYLSAIFSLILFGWAFIDLMIRLAKRHPVSWMDLAIMAASILTLILTHKRAMIVCFFIATLITIFIFLRQRPRIIGKVLFIVFLLMIISYILVTKTEFGQALMLRFTDVEDISSGRMYIYSSVLKDIQGGLLFGKGTGSSYTIFSSGIHNIYLQILHDNGIVGLSLWVVLFIVNLFSGIKRAIESHFDPDSYLNVFIQIVFLVYGFFGNPLFNTALLTLYFCTIGYTFSYSLIEKRGLNDENWNSYFSEST